VNQALADLKEAAVEGRNIMPPSIAAAKAGVTTSEWGTVLREVFGEYRAPTGIGATHEVDDARMSEIRDLVSQVSGKLDLGAGSVKTMVMSADEGLVADCIADYAQENGIDLIVMATHGRSGVKRWVRGSIADKVLRSSNIPVLMIRAPGSEGRI